MNDAAQSTNIYYGAHVPGWLQDLSPVTAFETSARKPVSIVMWYQGWGLTDGFSNQLPHAFPKIKAVVWFNENKETDWRIESSPAAQTAFANAISSNIYASNQYATLNTSSIPSL